MPTLILAIDARRMKQGADESTAATKTVTTGATEATGRVDGLNRALDGVGAKAKGAAPALDATAAALVREKDAAAAAEAALVRNTRAVEGAADVARKAERDTANLGASWRDMGDSARDARGPLNDLRRSSSDLALAQQALGQSSIKALAFATQSTGLLEVANRMQQAVSEFKVANTVIDVTTGVTTKSVSSFGALGGVLLSIATNPVTLVIAGITAVAAAIGHLTAETEEAKKAAEDHKRALEEQARAADLYRSSGTRLDRAKEINDDEDRAAAISDRIRLLEEESVRLRQSKEEVIQLGKLERLGIDRSIGFRGGYGQRGFANDVDNRSKYDKFFSPDAPKYVDFALPRADAIRELEAKIRELKSDVLQIDAKPFGPEFAEGVDKAAERIDETVTALRRETEAMRESADVTELLNNLRRAGIEAYGPLTAEQQKSADTIAAETAALQLSRREKEASTKAATEHEEAIKSGIAQLVDRIFTENKAQQAEADGVKSVRESISAYEAETAALKVSETERAISIETRRIANAEIAKGHKLTIEETAAIRAMVTARIAATGAQESQTAADRRAKDAAEELTAAQKAQREEAARAISDLRFDTSLVGQSRFDADRERALRELRSSTKDLPADERDRALGDLNAALRARNDAQARDSLRLQGEELSLIGRTAEERRRIVELRRFEADYGSEALAQYRDQLEELQRSRAEMERMERLAFGIGDNLANGIERAVYDAQSLGDVFESISRLGFSEFFTTPAKGFIGSGLSSLFGAGGTTTANAFGNVYNGGRLIPYAMGGVFSGPTTRPLADGNTGLFGEAGPEGAFPLKRMRDGRFGVAFEGGGGGKEVVIYQTVNIGGGGDVYGGVHRSTRQAYAAARQAVETG